MLVALGLDDAEDVIPIYLGDDRTDEDAFKVLKERSAGLGILISSKVRSRLLQQNCSLLLLVAVLCDDLFSIRHWPSVLEVVSYELLCSM